jgi:RNA polymerase sigma-70 factor (ECF subfamily)
MREVVGNDHPNPDSTASDLLSAARRMDPVAWQEVLDRYSWLIFQWCRNAGLRLEDAADVVQTVMAQAAVSLSRFQKDGKRAAFRRWLRTITRRRITDFRRADANQPHGEGGSSAQQRIQAVAQDASDSSLEHSAKADLRAKLWKLLEQFEDELDEVTWQAFWLTFVENLTSSEAGLMLGMTSNAVRLAKGRVLQRLREAAAAES